MSSLATVIIPTFNKEERLELVLESLNHQIMNDGAFEVIVVDDGSEDGTKEKIKRFNNNYSLSYIKISNSGRARARNVGIEAASGDIIIFIDDDLLISPFFIQEHMDSHKVSDGIIVHGRILNLPYLKFFKNPITGELFNEFKGSSTNIDSIKKFLLNKDLILDDKFLKSQSKITYMEKKIEEIFAEEIEELKWLGFTGGNVSCSKKILEESGGFDIDFGLNWGCEDFELGYRLHLLGGKFTYSYEALNYHMAHYRMSYKDETANSVKVFYEKYNSNIIAYLDKLLLGKIKDPKEYLIFIKENKVVNNNG